MHRLFVRLLGLATAFTLGLTPSIAFAQKGGGHGGGHHGSTGSGSSGHSATAGTGVVHVQGYTRKDGTHVEGYDRRVSSLGEAAAAIHADRSAARSNGGRQEVETVPLVHGTPRTVNGATAYSSGAGIRVTRDPATGIFRMTNRAETRQPPLATSPTSSSVRMSSSRPSKRSSSTASWHKGTKTTQPRAASPSRRIVRSTAAKHTFEVQTGYPHGRPGYVVDHIVPLACGGADAPSNMQWQTIEAGKAKDRVERNGCGRR